VHTLQSGAPELYEQEERAAQYYSRPSYADLLIDWSTHSAESIAALVRASNPMYGGAKTMFRNGSIQLLEVRPVETPIPSGCNPGTVICADTNEGLHVATADGKALSIAIAY